MGGSRDGTPPARRNGGASVEILHRLKQLAARRARTLTRPGKLVFLLLSLGISFGFIATIIAITHASWARLPARSGGRRVRHARPTDRHRRLAGGPFWTSRTSSSWRRRCLGSTVGRRRSTSWIRAVRSAAFKPRECPGASSNCSASAPPWGTLVIPGAGAGRRSQPRSVAGHVRWAGRSHRGVPASPRRHVRAHRRRRRAAVRGHPPRPTRRLDSGCAIRFDGAA